MKVAVIIPTIDRAELDEALASLHAQSRAPDEIIVEHDPDERGAAATRNAAARRTQADVLLFMDDDCVAAPNWVERMCAVFEEGGAAITAVSGAVIYRGSPENPAERAVQNPDARWFMGANCGVRRAAFWKLGGFPEKYQVYEDKAFALACWMKGYGVARAPTAAVYHAPSFWNARLAKKFATHLSWWAELVRDYDVWADLNNPPPIWARHIVMPRDFLSFLKNFARVHDGAARLRARLLARQRLELWKRAIRNKMFLI